MSTTPEKTPCLCGCGYPVAGYFKRGHSNRFTRRLADVEMGVMHPEQAFPPPICAAMGPWTTTTTDNNRVGWRATTTDFDTLKQKVAALSGTGSNKPRRVR